ncbi:small subunit ribosomal protein S17 [Mycoplasmoides fastidiosum]|uniref:Small ribosomal subunit protein uS17 n=1 Tax=Mycoplasmoides fastidiosum TaxID=92758 RepID=A0ABU0LY63_9BACT|nr:small subunit ribosomal protein S17 [Mycoplasmoides fastidiosum]
MNQVEKTQPTTPVTKKYRKVLKGVVVSTKNAKTIVVKVESKFKHPLYKKLVIRHKKYHAHDELEKAKEGDFVSIIETRPLSALKNWRLNKILTEAK